MKQKILLLILLEIEILLLLLPLPLQIKILITIITHKEIIPHKNQHRLENIFLSLFLFNLFSLSISFSLYLTLSFTFSLYSRQKPQNQIVFFVVVAQQKMFIIEKFKDVSSSLLFFNIINMII